MTEQQPQLTNTQTEKLVSHGHEYADTPKMREIVGRADEIRATLPLIPEGHTRLWRGNRPGELGKNPSYTNSLEGIALPFLDGYGGDLSYIDIPNTDLDTYLKQGGAAGSEFILPSELVATVRVAGMSDEQAEELKKQSKDTSSKVTEFDSPVG